MARRRKLFLLGGASVLALGVSVTIGYKAADHARSPEAVGRRPWHGKIAKIARSGAEASGSGLTVRDARGEVSAAEGAEIGLGAEITTDGRTRVRLELDDGTSVVLDRATKVAVEDGPRTLRVKDGSVVADVAHIEGAPFARLLTATGEVAVLGTKFMLTSTDGRTSVEVVRGVVELHDADSKVQVAAGQEGIAARGAKLEIAPVNDLAQRLAFGERLGITSVHNEDTDLPVSGLGELRARRPNRTDEKDHAVRLASHDVKVRIVGNVARTEIDETFNNDTDEVLEGLYRFPLPPGAQMERLALDVDGKLIDGSFVDKAKGAAIWRGALQAAAPDTPKPKEEIFWVPGPWHDPALLEWQRGGRFELKIFPIPKHGSRRVVLAYTETVAPVAGVRRYVYPLPQSTASDLKIGTFSVDLQVLGHEAKDSVHVRGYEIAKAEAGEAGGERFKQTMSGFVPSGDLGVEYTMTDRKSDVTAWGYRDVADGAYVALALRPKLPGWTDVKPRDVVIAVDAGRSMFGERFARARRLAVQMVEEMDRRDRVAVLACDVECRAMAGPFVPAGSGAAHDADKFLSAVEPDGASDLVGAVRAGEGLGGHDRARDLRVVLISDGLASAGYRRPERIATEVRDAMAGPRDEVITVPIGTDADVDTLQAIARGGGGVVVPYAPGEMLEVAALDVVNATCGTTLRDVEIVLPEGLGDVAPQKLAPIRAGGETIVTARIKGERAERVSGDVVLRGKVGGEAFEAKYPIDLLATSDKGNAFVPRLYAAARIADRERDAEVSSGEQGKKLRAELVSLSQKYAVPSRFTSLLVLESEAMFQAFGIDRRARGQGWTGESLATGSEASDRELQPEVGDLGTDDRAISSPLGSVSGGAPADLGHGLGGLVLSGGGSGGAGKTSERSPVTRAAAPPQSAPPPPPAPAATATMASPARKAPAVDEANPREGEAADKKADKNESRPEPSRQMATASSSTDFDSAPWAGSRGRFMKRVWVRKFALSNGAPPAVAADKLVVARAALQAAPDERGKYNKLVRLLSANGQTEELGEVLARWSSRDPLDADAIAARGDLAARAGDRPRALRILDGVASGTSSPSADVPMLEALALAHERAGERANACAFRVAVAELRSEDADRIARAVACEREAGRPSSADRWLDGRSDRTAVETAVTRFDARVRSGSGPVEDVNRGDILVDATWDAAANEDIDVAVIDPNGVRLGWVGQSRNVRVGDATSRRHEALAVSSGLGGAFTIELVRVAGGNAPVNGNVTLRAGGEKLSAPFVLSGSMTQVARINARFEQQLVPVDGPIVLGPFNRGASAAAVGGVSLTQCHTGDGVFGQGRALIEFTSTGMVSSVLVEPPFAGTKTGRCVQAAYRRIRVPAFAGGNVTLPKSFVVSP